MMKYLLLSAVFSYTVFAKCPNACNGHGTCNIHDQCTCFNEEGKGVLYLASDEHIGATCFNHNNAKNAKGEPDMDLIRKNCEAEKTVPGYTCAIDPADQKCKRVVKNELNAASTKHPEWTGADCSKRTCPRSTSWTTVGNKHKIGNTEQTYICSHKTGVECSDQGLCDRATGLCECFPGYTGSACQRTQCPDGCSGHGTCRSNRDFAYDFAVSKSYQLLQSDLSTEKFKENYIATYDNAWDSNHLYGCLCDRGYRGANCALIECPSSNDPLDDKCSNDEHENVVEDFQVQKFAATGSKGWREAYVDSTAAEQLADPCDTVANRADKAACEGVKGPNNAKCKYTAPIKVSDTKTIPARCEKQGVWEFYAPGDKNNHFYNGKVYACFGAMSGQDCSGRGICDYSTGQCSCFSGYSGTSCSKIEELV